MSTVSTPAWDTGYDNAEAVVANLALARIGADPIKDDAEDTPATRQVRVAFGQTRDELLRDYEFNFAQKSIYLTEDSGTDYTTITSADDSYVLTGFSGLTADALIGQFVTGTNIADGTKVTDNSTTTVTVDRLPIADGAATVNISVTGPKGVWDYSYVIPELVTGTDYASTVRSTASLVLTGFSGLVSSALVGYLVTGTGIIGGTKVTANDATTVTIDTYPSTSGTATVNIAAPPSPVMLRILEIGGNKDNLYEIIGAGASKRLLCNCYTYSGVLEVKFVEQIINPDSWDSLFKDAFVLRLASKLAIPLTKRPDLAQALQAEFAAIYTLARTASAKEKKTDEVVELWTKRGTT